MAMSKVSVWVMVAGLIGGCASAPTRADVRRMGQRGETEQLFDAWQGARTDAVRVAVIEAFADNSSDHAGQRLIVEQAQRAGSKPVQLAALRALAAYSGDEVIGALVPALGHAWPEAREVAQSVLAQQGAATHGPLLAAAVSDSNPWVRAGALRLLTRGAQVSAPARASVQEALLDRAQKDSVAQVRQAAVDGLGALGVPSARAVLGELVRTDPDSQVRLRSGEALRKLGQPAGREEIVVAVLPLKDDTGGRDPEVLRLGQQVAEYVAARLSASKVCTVIEPSKIEAALAEMRKVGKLLYDGDSPNAPEIGAFKLANQLVFGSVQRQGATYTVVLKRMDVSTLQLVPGAAVTVSGHRADLEQLKKEAADRLVRRFN